MNKKLTEYKLKRFGMFVKKRFFAPEFFSAITRKFLAPFVANYSENEYKELCSVLSLFYNDITEYVKERKESKVYLWQIYVLYKNSTKFELLLISFSGYNFEHFKEKALLRPDDVVYQVVADKQNAFARKLSKALATNISLFPRFFEKQLVNLAIQN